MYGASALSGYSTTGTDNTKTYTITRSQLVSADNNLAEGRYFDFKIAFTNYVGTIQDTPDGSDHYYDVSFPGGANLKYDVTAPTVSVSYPADENGYFNTKEISYTLSENLYNSPDPPVLPSTITLNGDNGGTGADNGSSYPYIIVKCNANEKLL